MNKGESTDFQKLLFDAWIDFQMQAGHPVSQKDFAEYLGINHTLLSHYFKGKRSPRSERIVKKLEDKLGPGIYPALGLANPDPMLRSIERRWHLLSPEVKEQISEIILEYEEEAQSVDKGIGMEEATG